MTLEEILALAESTVLSVNKTSLTAKDKEVKGVHDLYEDSVKMAKHISYHAVKGVFPEELFINRSPNQTQKEYDYIKANYKQYTFPEFVDFFNTATRPLFDGNWSIVFKDEKNEFVLSDNTLKKYLESQLPIYNNIYTLFKDIYFTKKLIDANAFSATRPKEIKLTKNGDGEDVISNELNEPTTYFFESDRVIDYVTDEYYLFLSAEKSLVKTAGGIKRDGNIYELYTKEGVYFYRQTGTKGDNKFERELFYPHKANRCFVDQLKGVPELKGDKILWMSQFIFGTDLLDVIATNANWLQFSIGSCMFPMKVMWGDDCEYKDEYGNACAGGDVMGYIDDKPYKSICPKCNGTGQKGRLSPLGVLIIKPKTKFNEGETQSTQPPLAYVSPPTASLEFVEKKIDKDTLRFRGILKLKNKNSIVNAGTEITATEVVDDAKGRAAFIRPIIDQAFEWFEKQIENITYQRYSTDDSLTSVVKPTSFDFKTSEDYLFEITNAIKNGLDITLIKTLLFQYVNSYYGDNQKTTLIFKLVTTANRLFGLSQDEINMKLSKGTVAKWESVLNDSIYNFINDAISESDKFLELPLEKQVEALQEKAKQVQSEISSEVVSSVYTPPIA